jgi:hypothetical protein
LNAKRYDTVFTINPAPVGAPHLHCRELQIGDGSPVAPAADVRILSKQAQALALGLKAGFDVLTNPDDAPGLASTRSLVFDLAQLNTSHFCIKLARLIVLLQWPPAGAEQRHACPWDDLACR